jgi:rhodanese-related sulfurtransferase
MFCAVEILKPLPMPNTMLYFPCPNKFFPDDTTYSLSILTELKSDTSSLSCNNNNCDIENPGPITCKNLVTGKCSSTQPEVQVRYPELTRRKSVPSGEVPLGLCITITTVQEISTLLHDSALNKMIITDVRSKENFDSCHITGAIHACCSSKLLTKRAVQVVESNLTSEVTVIVICTENGNCVLETDPVAALVNKLRQNKKLEVKMLDGGIKKFRKLYKAQCDWQKPPILLSPTNEHFEADIDDVYNQHATQILPFLYLGNEYDSIDEKMLKDKRISKILNVTNQLPFPNSSDFECKRLPASDSSCQDLRKLFDEAFAFIESARLSKSNVLVHCQAGISRSPSIVIAYIMKHSNLGFQEALQVVREQRSIVSPNFHFLGQLMEFEKDLIRGTVERSNILCDTELRKSISCRPFLSLISQSL